MRLTPIRSEAELDKALARAEVLMDRLVKPGTREGDELEVLALLIRDYEDKHWPIGETTPVEIIQFSMSQNNLTPKDLIPYIGSQGKVSEVLSGKRPLSLNMIRRLHDGLKIPADLLIGGTIKAASAKATSHKPTGLRNGARKARHKKELQLVAAEGRGLEA